MGLPKPDAVAALGGFPSSFLFVKLRSKRAFWALVFVGGAVLAEGGQISGTKVLQNRKLVEVKY